MTTRWIWLSFIQSWSQYCVISRLISDCEEIAVKARQNETGRSKSAWKVRWIMPIMEYFWRRTINIVPAHILEKRLKHLIKLFETLETNRQTRYIKPSYDSRGVRCKNIYYSTKKYRKMPSGCKRWYRKRCRKIQWGFRTNTERGAGDSEN